MNIPTFKRKEAKQMPRYRVENRITKEVMEIEAPFAQAACEKAGWLIGNCYVKSLRKRPSQKHQSPTREDEKGGEVGIE